MCECEFVRRPSDAFSHRRKERRGIERREERGGRGGERRVAFIVNLSLLALSLNIRVLNIFLCASNIG